MGRSRRQCGAQTGQIRRFPALLLLERPHHLAFARARSAFSPQDSSSSARKLGLCDARIFGSAKRRDSLTSVAACIRFAILRALETRRRATEIEAVDSPVSLAVVVVEAVIRGTHTEVDGMVACGLNDVVRIQKYSAGGVLGRHVDQCVRRADGRISQYSLRVFLNGCDGREGFQGGLSVFHVSGRPDPIALEPEGGLALLYPQGDRGSPPITSLGLLALRPLIRSSLALRPPTLEVGRAGAESVSSQTCQSQALLESESGIQTLAIGGPDGAEVSA